MSVLALFLPDPGAQARLASALEGWHDVVGVTSWRRLNRLVKRRPVELCVLDLYDPFRPISVQKLQKMRRRYPDLAIVVHGDFEGRASDLFELGRLQVHGVLQATGHEQRHEIRQVIEGALARSTAARVVRTLDGRLSPFALECLAWAVERAETHPRVGALASAMGTSESGLSRELRDHDLPTARTLLLWGRLFQAARLLQSGSATVDSVAFRVGYATGGALRRALKQHCGHPPGELARRGGLRAALHAFITTVAASPRSPRIAPQREARRWSAPSQQRGLPTSLTLDRVSRAR